MVIVLSMALMVRGMTRTLLRNARLKRSELERFELKLSLLSQRPVTPMCFESFASLRLIVRHMQFPVDGHEPLYFIAIDLADRNAAYFRPRSILERVVIVELGSEEQGYSEHVVQRALAGARFVSALRGELC